MKNTYVVYLSRDCRHLLMNSFKGPPGITALLLVLLAAAVSAAATTEYWNHQHPLLIPPDPKRPCRHAFRDDPETSALLADFVVIGTPIPTHRSSPGILYNASILVEQVLKRPRFSIYPVRANYPILAGPFSEWSDFGRCRINLNARQKYIFFVERPNWIGFFRITQLPLVYTNHRWRKIRAILSKKPSPLKMHDLHHEESIRIAEGEEVVLACSVMGRPPPLISWYANSTHQMGLWNANTGRGVMNKNRRNSRLLLANLRISDSGTYSCFAENVNGYIKKTVKVHVLPKPSPTLPVTTLPPKATVHPCYRFCVNGFCSLIDDRPTCSCISPYYGTRCEISDSLVNDKIAISKSNCTTGCDHFLGQLILFSTLGALFTLLLLLIVCLFVRNKVLTDAHSPHLSLTSPTQSEPFITLPCAVNQTFASVCNATRTPCPQSLGPYGDFDADQPFVDFCFSTLAPTNIENTHLNLLLPSRGSCEDPGPPTPEIPSTCFTSSD